MRKSNPVTTRLVVSAVAAGAAVVLAAVGLAAPAQAITASQQWTQVRGDAGHTGFNAGETVIKASNVTTLTRRFAITDTGDVGTLGETVVAGGRFFVLGTAIDDPSTSVRAFDPSTGAKLWSARISQSSGVSDVAYAGGRLYVLTERAVTALNAQTGVVVWKHAVSCAFDIAVQGTVLAVSEDECAAIPEVHFFNVQTGAPVATGCSGDPDAVGFGGPSILNGVTYLTANQTVACRPDGSDAPGWTARGVTSRTPTFPAVTSTGVYAAGSQLLRAMDTAGRTQWTAAPLASEGSWKTLYGMSVDATRVYLTYKTSGGAGAITAFARSNGSRLWSVPASVNAAPCVANGLVFTAEGSAGIAAYSTSTGAQLWRKPGVANSAPPVVADGQLYVGWSPPGTSGRAQLSVFRP